MNERITRSIFFLPLFRGYSFNNKYKYIPNDKVYYVATHGNEFSSLDFTSLVEGWAGVSAFAISQAVYMGCNPIYLLGFDHDYLANRGVDHHFYEGGTIKGDTQTNIPLGDRIPYDVEMKANMKLWMNYRNLKRIANKKGIKILNATEKGYLDVFDRVNYNDIIQK